MICVFPDPYPDELLYSLCARYKDLMQYPNKLTATRDFFGSESISAIVDLPNRIDYLISALPPGHFYTVDEFLDCHTMFPFFAPFLSCERARLVRNDMRRVGENRIFERIGKPVSHFADQHGFVSALHVLMLIGVILAKLIGTVFIRYQE